ncbi:MAG TPA: hypothetical protein VFF09_03590 [archaeon]|nr:hypothetical protein [archaeon]
MLLSVSGCFAKPTNSVAECENQGSAGLRDSCYFQHALSENDLGRCTQIIDANTRNGCINSFP